MKFMNYEWNLGVTGWYAMIYIGGFKFELYQKHELANGMKSYKLVGLFWQTHYACKEQTLVKFQAEDLYKAIEWVNNYLKTVFFDFEEVETND